MQQSSDSGASLRKFGPPDWRTQGTVASFPISVLLPVRDGQATLAGALKGLLAGLGHDDEIVVVDDGSVDGTCTLVRRAMAHEPRLRLIRTKGVGLVGALNLGLREVAHDWVARADADDLYPSERLLHQRRAIREGVVLVTGDYRVRWAGKVLSDFPCALTPPFVAASLIHPQRIPHPGVLFNRQAVLAVGSYRSEDFPAEDLSLWLRLATTGDFVGVPHVVVHWTMSPGSITHSSQAAQRRMVKGLLAQFLPRGAVSRIGVEKVEGELQSYRGQRSEAVRRLLLARDLRALSKLGISPQGYAVARRYLLRSTPATILATSRVVTEKRRRENARRAVARPQRPEAPPP